MVRLFNNGSGTLSNAFSRLAPWIVLGLACLLLPGGPALAQTPDAVEALGSSRIYDGNVQNAREAALQDSFKAAVAAVVAGAAPSDMLAAHFQKACEAILDKAETFVQEFNITAEHQSAKTFWVMTRVTLDSSSIIQTLHTQGVLGASENLPVLLFLVNEQDVGESAPRHWWGKAVSQALVPQAEQIMTQAMAEKGFQSVDGRDAIRALVAAPMFDPASFDLSQAMKLAQQAQAQVMIVGESSARRASSIQGTDMKSYSGSVTARAIDAETGEQIAASVKEAAVVGQEDQEGGREAIAQAARQAAEELASAVKEAYKTEAQGPAVLDLHVTGIRPLGNVVAFRKALKEDVENVVRVLPKGMTDAEALIQVEYKGPPQALARQLVLLPFEKFSIQVGYVGAGRMDVTILPSARPGFQEPAPAPE